MSAASLITKYGKNVTLRVYGAGTSDSDGAYVSPTPTDTTIVMSIQPLKGNEALSLPEGIRNSHVMKGYTVSEVVPGSETDETRPNQIVDGGIVYHIKNVEYFEANSMNIAPYYKAMLVRVNPT